MKKKELLAPAGNMEALYQAVQNGCDAVYLSGKSFGARKFAANFNYEELKNAIAYCHVYDVRVYVTVNTLVHDSEIKEFLDYIAFLYEENVDALIMQDLGMIRLLRDMYPELVIHASTQLHNHNVENIKLLESLGVKRAILARELTLEEISKLGNNLELEVFVHGALCICYSGQCLMSSLVMNRSGNRGECAGLCRLPYTLLENGRRVELDGNYLLSPKELNTLSDISKLLDLEQVTSLKIEGRMKSPEYVGYITSLYRKVIDAWEQKREEAITEEEDKNLRSLYNREFTKGHLFYDREKKLMNLKTPNHIGILLGQVVEVNSKKIKVELSEDLNQGDGIRFSNGEGMIANFIYNNRDLLVSSASKGDFVWLDNKVELIEVGQVYKTSDKKLLESLALTTKRKIKITGKLIAQSNLELSLEISDGLNTILKKGKVCEEARTAPLTKDRIREQLDKIKNTPFEWEYLEITTDHVFISIKELNELRRDAIDMLIEARVGVKRKQEVGTSSFNIQLQKTQPLTISVAVRTKEQFEIVKRLGVERIYVDNEELYNQVKSDQVFLRLNRVVTNYKERQGDNLVIGEVGGLIYSQRNIIITDYFCNAYNAKTVAFFLERGASLVTLSVELSKDDILNLLNELKLMTDEAPVSLLVYGRVEVMIMKHCPLAISLKTGNSCKLCKEGKIYELEDRNHERYPLRSDCPYTHIFNYKVENRIREITTLKKAGLRDYRIELFDESESEIIKIVSSIRQELDINTV